LVNDIKSANSSSENRFSIPLLVSLFSSFKGNLKGKVWFAASSVFIETSQSQTNITCRQSILCKYLVLWYYLLILTAFIG